MDKTIAYALGEIVSDDYEEVGSEQLDALKGKRVLLAEDNDLNAEWTDSQLSQSIYQDCYQVLQNYCNKMCALHISGEAKHTASLLL